MFLKETTLRMCSLTACVNKPNFYVHFVFKIAYMKLVVSVIPCFLSQEASHLTRYDIFFKVFPRLAERIEIYISEWYMLWLYTVHDMICIEYMRQEKTVHIPLPQSLHIDCIYCSYMFLAFYLHSPMFQSVKTPFNAYQWNSEVHGFRMNGWVFNFGSLTKLSSV